VVQRHARKKDTWATREEEGDDKLSQCCLLVGRKRKSISASWDLSSSPPQSAVVHVQTNYRASERRITRVGVLKKEWYPREVVMLDILTGQAEPAGGAAMLRCGRRVAHDVGALVIRQLCHVPIMPQQG